MLVEIALDGIKVLSKALRNTLVHFFPPQRAMTVQESLQILDIKVPSPDSIKNAFNNLYEKNSKKNSGSPYIRSRVLNAFRRLEAH